MCEAAGTSMEKVSPVPVLKMDDSSSPKVEPSLCLSEDYKLVNSRPSIVGHLQKNEANKMNCAKAEDSAFPHSCSSDPVNSVESRKRKYEDFDFHGAPLPYLIRPLMKLDIYNGFDLYNDYAESLSDSDGSDYSVDDESDQGQGFIPSNSIETSPLLHLIPPNMRLDKYNGFDLNNECAESLSDEGGSGYLLNDESDEDYILVEDMEPLPNSGELKEKASQKEKLPDARTVNQNDLGGFCCQEKSVSQGKGRVHQTVPVDAEFNEDDWEIV